MAASSKSREKTRARAAGAPDPLGAYRAKRDFSESPEPAGPGRRAKAPRFVVQKHAARRLHYDVRLEIEGVLKSWAVTRGPSLVVGERRLAVETEDHPLSYLDFEGVIPKGQYGGGSVIVWDIGTWTPEGDPAEGHKAGKLTFTLAGERLRGRWHLVRTRPRGGRTQWLLLKGDDAEARGMDAPDVLAAATSVRSGLTNAEIEAGGTLRRDHAVREAVRRKAAKRPRPAAHAAAPAGAKPGLLPLFVEPCLATLADAAPTAAGWLHEIKFDGYRLQVRIDGDTVRLLTRSGLDWTERFEALVPALRALGLPSASIDGEVVVEDASGVSSFARLQAALDAGEGAALRYYAFDLLYLDGHDLRPLPLGARKAALAAALAGAEGSVRLSQHLDEDGDALLRHACRLGLEGIVSKRADAPYRSGRGRDWLKVKCSARQELVVAGFTPSSVVRGSIGALVLGVHDAGGTLVHVGRVGTGFSGTEARRLHGLLEPLRRSAPPFAERLPPEASRGGVRWVEPRLVAEVDLRGWTGDGQVRHASFRGLRDDKDPAEIRRETPASRTGAQREAPMRVALTHPDKILWPDVGLTKQGLADVYLGIADWLLPQVAGRPLSLVRGPQGAGGKLFFQKHAWAGLDAQVVRRLTLGDAEALAIDDIDGVMALVQADVLEIHVWGSRVDDAERPDRLVFDLDPGEGAGWPEVVAGASEVRERLRAEGHASYVKTTGGKGLHVVLPLVPSAGWDEAKRFAARIAAAMAADAPQAFTATLAKSARRGRVFVDYLRNGRGATAVAAYSTRARAGAPVATPVAWDELASLASGDAFRVDTLARRLDHLASDPWADMARTARPLGSRPRRRSRAKADTAGARDGT